MSDDDDTGGGGKKKKLLAQLQDDGQKPLTLKLWVVVALVVAAFVAGAWLC